MSNITRLLALALYALAAGEPGSPSRQLSRRGDGDAFQMYSRQFAREYEPYMFAAIPLHAPVPVLRVLSRAPLALQPRAQHPRLYPDPELQDPRPSRQSTRHYAKPARPYAPEHEYEASTYEYPRATSYRKPPPPRPRQVPSYEYGPYAASLQVQPAAAPAAPYEAEAYATQEAAPAPAVLYARPSPGGGFTYRRVPDATAPHKKKASATKEKEKDPPFIVKIHKYRVVRDDLI